MGKYGDAAVRAIELYKTRLLENPLQAWEDATTEFFGKGTSLQKKACPRGTFLGLCEDGLIKGIPKGNYTKSKDNKMYAISIYKQLRKNPELMNFPNDEIFRKTMIKLERNPNKKPNNQVDVVKAIFKRDLFAEIV
jgi:hypothetical protein